MKKQNKKTNRHSGKQSASRIRSTRLSARFPEAALKSQDNSSQSSISNNNSFQRIYDVVRKIPKGKVMTYKQVSLLANVATPRVVGFALHVNKDPLNIPCHRVVFSTGKLSSGYAFGGENIQKEKLQKEGIEFNTKGEVLLEEHAFTLSS